MNKVIHTFYAILLIGCCDTEVVSSKKLTEFENQLIPYYEMGNSYFTDENANSVRASIQVRELDTYGYQNEESCEVYETQRLTGSIYFFPRNFAIHLEINTLGGTTMKLTEQNFKTTVGQNIEVVSKYNFAIDCENIYASNLEESLTNVVISQFEFDNVLVFKSCDANSNIDNIICTPEKGVEFIAFKDSTYLKLLN
jgi:hypothetical protein